MYDHYVSITPLNNKHMVYTNQDYKNPKPSTCNEGLQDLLLSIAFNICDMTYIIMIFDNKQILLLTV